MEKEKSVWKQIKEDQEDYKHFKEQDNEKLQKTLDAIQLEVDKNE